MLELVELNSKKWLELSNLKNEIWKDVINYEGLYKISNYGRVKSLERIIYTKNKNQYKEYFCEKKIKEKILYNRSRTDGYLYVKLSKNGVSKNEVIHRMVAEAFILNIENKSQVNHKDGNKKNNYLNNLEWNTPKENMQHAKNILHIDFSKGNDKTHEKNKKRILQYDMNDNFIQDFNSIKEAKEYLNIKETSGAISLVCEGKRKSAYGYKWKYNEGGKDEN